MSFKELREKTGKHLLEKYDFENFRIDFLRAKEGFAKDAEVDCLYMDGKFRDEAPEGLLLYEVRSKDGDGDPFELDLRVDEDLCATILTETVLPVPLSIWHRDREDADLDYDYCEEDEGSKES